MMSLSTRKKFTEHTEKFLTLINRFSKVVRYKTQKTQLHFCLLILNMQKLKLKTQHLLQLLREGGDEILAMYRICVLKITKCS